MDWCAEPEGVYRRGEEKLDEMVLRRSTLRVGRSLALKRIEIALGYTAHRQDSSREKRGMRTIACATRAMKEETCNEKRRDAVELMLAGKAPALYACQRVTYT